MPGTIRNFSDVQAFFDSDPIPRNFVVPVNIGPCPPIEKTVIFEDEESVVFYDSWGIKRRDIKANTSMSEFIQFPVTDKESWQEYKEKWLNPDDPHRLDGDWGPPFIGDIVGEFHSGRLKSQQRLQSRPSPTKNHLS
jgi:hypothetical protein